MNYYELMEAVAKRLARPTEDGTTRLRAIERRNAIETTQSAELRPVVVLMKGWERRIHDLRRSGGHGIDTERKRGLQEVLAAVENAKDERLRAISRRIAELREKASDEKAVVEDAEAKWLETPEGRRLVAEAEAILNLGYGVLRYGPGENDVADIQDVIRL